MGMSNKKRVQKKHKKKLTSWYTIKVPDFLGTWKAGQTILVQPSSKARDQQSYDPILEICYADLKQDEDHAHLKIRLRVNGYEENSYLTTFAGMTSTADKI